MKRKIEQGVMNISALTTDALAQDVRAWLVNNAPESAETLLAFALDGLIWGRLKDGQLMVAADVETDFSPELDISTLQEARLFGPTAELHLWRTETGFRARAITDAAGAACEYLDETQILWGDQAQPVADSGFSLMSDGVQGLQHAVPLPLAGEFTERPLRLKVRHYLDHDKPLARIAHSRLVQLEVNDA
jgi:CRISPR-associated protein (TIGR03984 family)